MIEHRADINSGISLGTRLPRQGGLALISWLIVLVVAVFLALALAHLVPAYLEYGEIGSSLHAVRKSARTKSLYEIRNELAEQLQMNGINDVSADEFKFSLNGDQLTISIDHPIETPFVGNLGFVVHCRRSMTVTRAQQF